jgi:ubiquinone/menaquinone biosynthesis C-methylase UbiE
MAKFHFVRDYERLVWRLRLKYPLDEAMSRAVGGNYEQVGLQEAEVVEHAGLRNGHALLDLGCGSGRLAWALGQRMTIDYCGVDIVKALLRYAKKRSPGNYRFILNRSLSLPLPDASFDMATAFSVFTHLLHHESYIYLEEFHRLVRPGGAVLFSFLEFSGSGHWEQFQGTVDAQRASRVPHLNQFIERSQIKVWADKLGYTNVAFVDGSDASRGTTGALGQSLAILRR